jgi:hypothetical protein
MVPGTCEVVGDRVGDGGLGQAVALRHPAAQPGAASGFKLGRQRGGAGVDELKA